MEMPTRGRNIKLPADIKPERWYLVKVAFHQNNPIHKALMYSGFASGGMPGNYHYFTHPTWDSGLVVVGDLYYLEIVKDLGDLLEEEAEREMWREASERAKSRVRGD